MLPCLHVSTAQSVLTDLLISRAVANRCYGVLLCEGQVALQASLGVFHRLTDPVQISKALSVLAESVGWVSYLNKLAASCCVLTL